MPDDAKVVIAKLAKRNCNLRLTSISRIPRLRQKCNLDFHSGEVTRVAELILT
eukprot:COSAG02_NODE_52861_length_305_cov_0.922330_1_plen_52_part_10